MCLLYSFNEIIFPCISLNIGPPLFIRDLKKKHNEERKNKEAILNNTCQKRCSDEMFLKLKDTIHIGLEKKRRLGSKRFVCVYGYY